MSKQHPTTTREQMARIEADTQGKLVENSALDIALFAAMSDMTTAEWQLLGAIGGLTRDLEGLAQKVEAADAPLNPLGELQGSALRIDVLVATVAAKRGAYKALVQVALAG